MSEMSKALLLYRITVTCVEGTAGILEGKSTFQDQLVLCGSSPLISAFTHSCSFFKFLLPCLLLLTECFSSLYNHNQPLLLKSLLKV